jgi:hypothetical protein
MAQVIPTTLFGDRTRSASPRTRQVSESLFEFCDRLDEPRVNAGRAIVNHWFAAYPDDLRPELVARLKSRRDTDHHSAMFELSLLAMLRNVGLDARAVAASTDLSVDLTVNEPQGGPTYIEATTVLGELDDPFFRLMQHVTKQILQSEPRIRLYVHEVVPTNENPSASRFSAWLLREFATSLTTMDVTGTTGPVTLKRTRYTCPVSGWQVELTLLCWEKPEPPRSSIVLMRAHGAGFQDSAPLLRRKIKDKLQQHRALDGPLVVALSWHDWFHEPDSLEVLDALCGVPPREQPLQIAALLLTSGVHVWNSDQLKLTVWLDEDGREGPWRRWPLSQVWYSSAKRRITSNGAASH